MTFTVPREKKLHELIKMEKKSQKNISYILEFFNTARSVASSLTNLVNTDTIKINVKLAKLNINIVTVFLNMKFLKMV